MADEMVAPRHVHCPHKYQEEEGNAKLQTNQNCCSVAPNPQLVHTRPSRVGMEMEEDY